jgi:SAM-dependent methyltransferase
VDIDGDAMEKIAHRGLAPSDWVRRWGSLVPFGGTVLDVACGHGRHVRWFAALGHQVTGLDRAEDALAGLSGVAETVLADIENSPWPMLEAGQPRQFDAVVVTNYLWRPLLQTLADSVAPGGLLIYETFASGNETVGRPANPDFLLRPGELLTQFADWRVIAFEDGFLPQPERFVQRLCAARPGGPVAALPRRYPLSLESGLTPTL